LRIPTSYRIIIPDMAILVQRWLLFAGMALLTLAIYYAIDLTNPHRYSIFKLMGGVNSTEHQQKAETARSSAAPISGAQLSPAEVPTLALMNREYSRVIKHVLPSLVSIDTEGLEQRRYWVFGMKNPDGTSSPAPVPVPPPGPSGAPPQPMGMGVQWDPVSDLGSGVFIHEKGYVVTNHHVVFGAEKIVVTSNDNQRYEAELVGADVQRDLAILRLKNTGDELFPVLNFANSDDVQVGELVLAIGNPFGFAGSVTQGVVSGTHRRLQIDKHSEFIQTDADINPGNSGGPLVNITGEIIGINIILYKPGNTPSEGVGLTLTSNQVIQTYEYIRSKQRETRAFLGAVFNELSINELEEAGLKGRGGALILEITAGSPAEVSNLKPGDIILDINGKTIQSVAEILAVIRTWDPRKELPMKVWRPKTSSEAAREVSLNVKLEPIQDVSQLAVIPAPLGVERNPEKLREELKIELYLLQPADKQGIGLPTDFGGIAVWMVRPDSPLSGHLLPLDIVHQIDGKPINTPEQFYKAMAALPSDKESVVTLTRNRRRYYLELRPE